ncbi:polysaccharide pyruvyl transferase family protein [Exiguobacterium antarcticum]|uniref:Polysaccharide pyruvyl transferase family protein n=1 Tax=Exiguobacterium antarcticum TaxID=132920 RepID=A0ABT6R5N6_9BACL|nr:polysaccharide pyruvyl transferase family protein [Exiguobacterium antarcticum]MDI3236270.1 polysaccharide pyruvyl transferase family protein [Exiguobacterium antarcticum]
MKKKIGVLTFHRSLNYGAVLQAYGLVKTIEKLNYEAEIIDYRNNELEKRDSFKRFYSTKGFVRSAFQIIESPMWFIRRKRFDDFLETIGISNKLVGGIDTKSAQQYSKIVVGSDQVWNYRVTDSDSNYLLGEITDHFKKASYAASFGISDIPNEKKGMYSKYLKSFNSISVREPAGANIVMEMGLDKPQVVIDPSLLLTKNEWLEVANKSNKKYVKPGQKYLVIYQRAFSKTLVEFAKKLAEIKNIEIVTINGNPRQPLKAIYVQTAGPSEWLDIINNAEYVITNSFHGVALSLNLNKELYVELLDEKFGVNSRLENIIDIFKIKSRVINNVNFGKEEKVNYTEVNELMFKYRKESLVYLSSALDKGNLVVNE